MSAPVELDPVRAYLEGLQDTICAALEEVDGEARFSRCVRESAAGRARPRVLDGGAIIERAAVNYTASRGAALPPAAQEDERRAALAGRPFEAASLSMIVHPRNPYAPTTHMNLRAFLVRGEGAPAWWFGGGFDLTPCYAFHEDAVHWHECARASCAPFGAELYPRFKEWCDRYFYLPHRDETRGVGGLFFDDLDLDGFDATRAFQESVGDHFLPAYRPLLEARSQMVYGERERSFQLRRRGRYVEFNLLYDRGTRYGLQSGRAVESVLASMPPLVRWDYAAEDEPGSPEAALGGYLRPRDWLGEAGQGS